MIKHIILWKLKEGFSKNEKQKIKEDIKTNLESLKGKIDGLAEIKVQIDSLDIPASNADVMLYSSFVNQTAYEGYIVHKDHVAVADNYVRPYTEIRLCMDYED